MTYTISVHRGEKNIVKDVRFVTEEEFLECIGDGGVRQESNCHIHSDGKLSLFIENPDRWVTFFK